MGTTVTPPVRMVLDCDPGIDDAVAIAWAVAHPAIDLVAVGSVWGNVDLDRTTRNAVQVLDACGAGQVPVARGAAGPRGGGTGPASGHVHGADGLGGLAMSTPGPGPAATTAAHQLVAQCRAEPGAIHVVALGPLTNLAEALDLEPDLPDLVAGVTLMGGAALVPGNVTPAAEANVFFDPLAARRVLTAPWSVTVAPLDATRQVRMDDRHVARLAAADSPIGRLLAGALDHYLGVSAALLGERAGVVHDVLAVAVAAGLVDATDAPTVHADVETGEGPGRGATIFDLRGHARGAAPDDDAHVRVVLDVADGFADQVVDTLVGAS